MLKKCTLIFVLVLSLLFTGCTTDKGLVRKDISTYGKPDWQQDTEYKVEAKGTVYNASDYDSIEEAIKDCVSKGGGTIYFASATYSITKSIKISLPEGVELTLIGDANGSSLLKGEKDIDGAVIEIQSKGVRLAHLTFQSFSNDKPAFVVKGEGTLLYRCTFQGRSVRNEESTVIVAASNTVLSSCYFSNVHPEAYTLRITKYKDTEVKNVKVVDFFLNGEFNGFLIDSEDPDSAPEDILLTRGLFLNYSKEQINIRSVKNCIVRSNMLDQSPLYCIILQPENAGIDGLSISENYIAASFALGKNENATSIYCETTQKGKAKNVEIKNNMIAYTMTGLHITSDDFSDFIIENNVFQSTQVHCMLIDSANNLTIQKNTFKPDGGSEKLKIINTDSESVVRNNF